MDSCDFYPHCHTTKRTTTYWSIFCLYLKHDHLSLLTHVNLELIIEVGKYMLCETHTEIADIVAKFE